MKQLFIFFIFFMSTYLQAEVKPLRVAVIGGLTMTGLWDQVTAEFEKKHGIKTQLVVTGNKKALNAYCVDSPVDFITMHSSDTISNLAAHGLIEELTPWIHNSQMLISEKSNPAGINQTDTLDIALRKIVDSNSKFVIHMSGGTFEVFHAISSKYTFKPKVLLTQKSNYFLDDVVSHQAYTLFGVIPYLMKKHYHPDIKGYFIDANALHRPYLAAIGTRQRIGKERYERAQLLLQFLNSNEVQNLIRDFRMKEFPKIPVFFPVQAINR